MSSPELRLQTLKTLLARYRQLPRHTQPELRQVRSRLYQQRQQWLRKAHASNLRQRGFEPFLAFYFQYLDRGIVLDSFLEADERSLKLAAHKQKTFAMVNGVLEFSLATQQLDDALAQALGDADDPQLLLGMASAEQLPARLQATAQLVHLGPGLVPFTRSRLAHAAFKLGTAAFRGGYLGPIFTVMDEGYSALRKIDNVEQAFLTLVETNQQAYAQLGKG